MNIHRPQRKHSPLILWVGGIIVALLIAGVCFYVFTKKPSDNYSPAYNEASSKNSTQNEDIDSIKEQPALPGSPETSEEIPSSSTGAIIIETLFQKDGYVNASAKVDQFDAQRCVYQFTSDGARPVIKEQVGSCKPVSIPQAEFEKIDTYMLNITAYNNGVKISTSKTIEIK